MHRSTMNWLCSWHKQTCLVFRCVPVCTYTHTNNMHFANVAWPRGIDVCRSIYVDFLLWLYIDSKMSWSRYSCNDVQRYWPDHTCSSISIIIMIIVIVAGSPRQSSMAMNRWYDNIFNVSEGEGGARSSSTKSIWLKNWVLPHGIVMQLNCVCIAQYSVWCRAKWVMMHHNHIIGL